MYHAFVMRNVLKIKKAYILNKSRKTRFLPKLLECTTIVHFKRLGSRHIHKEIKLHTNKCNTFSDIDFEAFS